MKLSTKLVIGAASLALGGSGILTGVALASGSSSPPPAIIQPVSPSGASADTTTTTSTPAEVTTTTTVQPTPTTIARQAPVTAAPVTTTTTVSDDVTVPNIIGDTFARAAAVLASVGLQINQGGPGCDDTPTGAVDQQATIVSQTTGTLKRGNYVIVGCSG